MYIYMYIYRKIIPWLKYRKLWLTKTGEPPFLPVQSVFLIVKSTSLLAKSPLFIQQHQNFTDWSHLNSSWITMSIYFMIDHFRHKSHEITIILWFSHGFPMVFPWFSHGFPTTTAPFSWGLSVPFRALQRGVPRRVEFSALLEWRGLEDGRKL